MKNIVIGICSMVLIAIVILTAYTLHGRSIRQTELNHALDTGMEKTMGLLQEERVYAPQSNEELIAFFMEAFTVQVDSSSDLTVHILDADYEKGLISVEAVMSFRHPSGGTGSVSAKRTMILEKYGAEHLPVFYTVQFFSEGKLYKQYTLSKGKRVPEPAEPKKEGACFVGWKDLESGLAVESDSLTAEKNLKLLAVFQ